MEYLNTEVTKLLDELNHPLRPAIEQLRLVILNSAEGITENIKWNGPNYSYEEQDRITMRVQPPKQIQLIFHRGAKKQAQPQDKLIEDQSGLLVWKENDRAIATFKNIQDVEKGGATLHEIVKKWIDAAK